jgi:G3E family GTPase
MAQPVPVTLLTGFLGSGKTTLLNGLLRHPGMDRVAVVVNEFGEIGLDHDLMASSTETMVLMSSGCLCCTVRGDMAQTLDDLRQRREGGEIDFDRVVIETTGLADPGPIVQTLVMDPDLTHDFVLDGVLTTADCATGPASLDAQFEAVQQVAMADRLILTKTDLVTPAARTAFEQRLTRINPGAPHLVAEHGAIDPAGLFGLAPRPDTAPDLALAWVSAAPPQRALPPLSGLGPASNPLAAAQSHGLFAARQATAAPATLLPGAGPARHDNRISSQSAELTRPVSPLVFDLWLESLMAGAAQNILRLKAVIHIEGLDHPFALHGVQHIVHPPVPLPDWPHGDTVSRIVVIGRDLAPGFLDGSLALLRQPPPVETHRL